MKQIKISLPFLIFIVIIISATQLMNFAQSELLDNYMFQFETQEKEEHQAVYYIDNSENFAIYPWSYYFEDSLINLTDIASVSVGSFGYVALSVYGEEVVYIPFSEFEYSQTNKLVFIKDYLDITLSTEYCYSIALPYQDYLETQMVNGFNYYIHTDSVLSFIKEKINKSDDNYSKEEILEIANELKNELDSLDTNRLQEYSDTKSWDDHFILTMLLLIYQESNYGIYSTDDDIYVVFTNQNQKTTFLYDPVDKEFLGFSVQS